jgi:protein-S-isoprenylcysteine O-methyltransferase Ste14
MTQEVSLLIFRYSWSLLLFITVLYLILFEDWAKTKAGVVTNFIVIVPYLMVFGLYYIRDYIGTYEGTIALRITGATVLFCGMAIYIYSHFLLRGNWSIMASIKKSHQLVKSGLYRYIRHPMYASMLLIVPGSGLLISNYLMLVSTPIVGAIYYIRAKKEEELLTKNLPGYELYVQETKMFIPRVF